MISLFICEIEYSSYIHADKKIYWLIQLLHDIDFKDISLMILYTDNNSDLKLTYNAQFHICIKHINIQCYWIRETLLTEQIEMFHIFIKKMLTDEFIKSLNQVLFKWMIKMLDLNSRLVQDKKKIQFLKDAAITRNWLIWWIWRSDRSQALERVCRDTSHMSIKSITQLHVLT